MTLPICIFLWSGWILKNSVNKTMYTATEVCGWYVFINHLLADKVHSESFIL